MCKEEELIGIYEEYEHFKIKMEVLNVARHYLFL